MKEFNSQSVRSGCDRTAEERKGMEENGEEYDARCARLLF
jgi:hypothetical protein